ncbi:unnamed protein product [Phytomonas sp. EM1]|nr:unnamed protein product [Phytomonas sp. EM1]|eukprot:CCW63094.1 unnamed protein product [Phytomonas sp. isolate EM1]
MENFIKQKILDELHPKELEVTVVSADEAKYSVRIVSEAFQNVPLVERHRMVNNLFKDELHSGAIHALSINAKPPLPTPAPGANPSA